MHKLFPGLEYGDSVVISHCKDLRTDMSNFFHRKICRHYVSTSVSGDCCLQRAKAVSSSKKELKINC